MIRGIIHEPLIHFRALGALLFAAHSVLTDSSDSLDTERIVVSAETVAWLEARWQKQWGRPGTEREVRGLIDQHVREEILYREGLAMGLDRDDTIIRRRLAQKLEYLVKDIGGIIEPTETELRTYFDEHPERFKTLDYISFTHTYFNPDSRAEAELDARDLLASLNGGQDIPAADRGDRFLLDTEYLDATRNDVAGQFGDAFSDRIFEIDENGWHGPVESGYGIHVVHILDRTDGVLPPFDEVREAVRTEIIETRRRDAVEDHYRRAREKYEVELTDPRFAAPGDAG
jgi:hypothetical protein